MIDYLRIYSKDFNMKIVYTQNKQLVLSTGINKQSPVIRAY
jgi:hypothetical protein